MRGLATMVAIAVALAGCATWSTSNVEQPQGAKPVLASTGASAAPAAAAPKTPDQIVVTESDITDRKYESLGDISVTVNKTTIFHDDPTPALVRTKLQEEAAKVGADAVVLVRYGSVGIGLFSWGSLDGKGRAVRFVQ